jgi:hypothetical protein
MKQALDLIREVLKGKPYCPTCNRFVESEEVRYSYGHPYHTRCGEDVHHSNLLDEHEAMLKRAAELLTPED